MKRSRLPFAVALLAAAALVLAVAAAPSRHARHLGQQGGTHEVVVWPYNSNPGAANADTGIELLLPPTQSAPAKAVVYVPFGYTLDLGIPAGTTIGTSQARATGSAGAVSLQGNMVVDTPARYTADPAAVACAGATPHAAVWVLQLASGTTTLPVTVFLDPTAGVETGLGAYKLQLCLPAPDVPQSAGGAPSGLRVTDLFAEPTRGVTNPATLGQFLWRAFVTPLVPGTTTQNVAGTDEARSIVLLPQVLTLKGRYDRKTGSIVLTGTLILASAKAGAGVDVNVWGSTKRAVSTFKKLGAVKTKKGTIYTYRRKSTKTMYFGTLVAEYFTGARCDTGASTAPAGCVQEGITALAYSPAVAVRVPAKKKK